MVKIDGTGEDAKYKTANWNNLVKLAKTTSIPILRGKIFERLNPKIDVFQRIAYLLLPGDTERLVP
jgi:hypothetical protein